MNFLGLFSPAETNSQSDFDRGLHYMSLVHNNLVSDYSDTYGSTTFQEFQDWFGRVAKFLPEGLGHTIALVEMDESDVQKAAKLLADRSRGNKFDWNWFDDAIRQVSTNPSLTKLLGETAVASAGDIAKGTAQIGDSVLATGKTLLTIGPILIVAAVVFIGYTYTQRAANFGR